MSLLAVLLAVRGEFDNRLPRTTIAACCAIMLAGMANGTITSMSKLLYLELEELGDGAYDNLFVFPVFAGAETFSLFTGYVNMLTSEPRTINAARQTTHTPAALSADHSTLPVMLMPFVGRQQEK